MDGAFDATGRCPKCGQVGHTGHICSDVGKVPQGWECPRCHKVHSPFVTECDCPPDYQYTERGDTKGS